MNRYVDEWTAGGWMGRYMYGCMYEWIVGCMCRYIWVKDKKSEVIENSGYVYD